MGSREMASHAVDPIRNGSPNGKSNMYASQKNVQILVALMKEHGVRHVVISPGSRNLALVRSLEGDGFFTCYSVVDERSAAYFAIGVSQETGGPVALSSTSAQATRNYIPGMTEAFYRGTPLVVITADYKPSVIGQGVMQSLDQMSIPKDSAKVSVRLPIVRDADDEWYCGRLVNEALLGLSHMGGGPVHIDMPVEEHWEGSVSTLPPVKKIERFVPRMHALPEIRARRVLVALGQHAPFTPDEEDALARFAARYGAVVYTNHLSNYHGAGAANGSLAIQNMDHKTMMAYRPDLVITVGGQIGDYGIDSFLNAVRPEHWRVAEDGAIVDTYKTLTKVFQFRAVDFFDDYASMAKENASTEYQELWAKANAKRSIPDTLPLSHAFAAAVLAPKIPQHSVMHFAILSALRNWNFFSLDPTVASYSNVAGFGIDGCLSTFVGHSVATDKLSFLVIGDLSFFYDMNAIGIRHVKPNARILLINNGGGGEFRLYSHAAERNFGADADIHMAAAGHHGAARAWVESMGWDYIEVRRKEDLLASADVFVGESERPILMEVFTTMKNDSVGVRVIREANTHESLERRLAKALPPGVKRIAKTILGRQ